jgi:L-fuculose-phosphate aldolase
MNETQARRDLVRYSHAMHTAGWVANHDGNLSVRLGADRIICTPTAFSKLDVTRDDLVLVNGEGKKIAGRCRPFSELVLHRVVYGNRHEVAAVVHAHPPYATAFGAAGRPLPHPFLPEAVVSLGPEIPTVPLTAPGAASVTALKAHVRRCDAVLIAGNGVLSWGPTLELAYLRLELVEHLAQIAHHATALGGVTQLGAEIVEPLLAKRSKAGLAAPEEGMAPGQAPDPVARAAAKVAAGIPNADPTKVKALAQQIAASIVGGR